MCTLSFSFCLFILSFLFISVAYISRLYLDLLIILVINFLTSPIKLNHFFIFFFSCSFGHNTVLRAIKPIKKGDMVFDNYGPIYSLIEINGRRKFLAEGYHFNCRCEACAHKYPLYNDINSHASDVVCMCCRLNFMLPNCVEMLQLCQKRCEQKNISREQRKQLEVSFWFLLILFDT